MRHTRYDWTLVARGAGCASEKAFWTELYENGLSMPAIAALLGVPFGTVRRRMRACGIPLRVAQRPRDEERDRRTLARLLMERALVDRCFERVEALGESAEREVLRDARDARGEGD